jgi:rod shape-determining protein MreD
VRGLWLALALLVALVLQTAIARWQLPAPLSVDLVTVVVIYTALAAGPMAGLSAGTVGGLVQDALSSGILGIGGLAKTLVGYFAGRFGTQFIVTSTLPRMVIFAGATVAHAVIFMGLYTVLGLRSFPQPLMTVAGQTAGNCLAGLILVQLIDWVPRVVERRRQARIVRVRR